MGAPITTAVRAGKRIVAVIRACSPPGVMAWLPQPASLRDRIVGSAYGAESAVVELFPG